MVNKRQASLILRVNGKESYFVQLRDNKENACFKFPGVLSLFGGELGEGEDGKEGFLREMNEELGGIDISRIKEEPRIYNWAASLKQIDGEINSYFNGNFNVLRGFQYDDLIPPEALGIDRGQSITYSELINALELDYYFIGEISYKDAEKIKVKEGRKGLILSRDICSTALFYPTDKIAIMHDISLGG